MNINSKQTEQAWNKLYARLENDGLLSGNSLEHSVPRSRFSVLKWAAAIAVLCISVASVYYINQLSGKRSPILSIQNQDVSSTLVTTLEDGSMVYLGNNARLDYPEQFAANVREVSLTGDAMFEVSGNPECPFKIDAGDVLVEVIGTVFHIRSNESVQFELSVTEGTVKVMDKVKQQEVFVSSGETARLTPDGIRLFDTTDSDYERFIRRIQFKDVPLSDIVRVVNRENDGIRLRLDPILNSRKLTVSFFQDSPETMAQLICLALKLNYIEESGSLLITPATVAN